jgi:hypothetical protein
MYNSNLLKHFTNDKDVIESQGIKQLGGNFNDLAIPASLFIVQQKLKNNKNIETINKNNTIKDEQFDLFLKNKDIIITKTRKKKNKQKRLTRKK